MNDGTVGFSVVSDPNKWEPSESFKCASQDDAIKAAALFTELHGVIERQAARIKELEKDAERLDWVQSQSRGGFNWIARQSDSGRGFRLHQTTRHPNYETARAAIDAARDRADK